MDRFKCRDLRRAIVLVCVFFFCLMHAFAMPAPKPLPVKARKHARHAHHARHAKKAHKKSADAQPAQPLALSARLVDSDAAIAPDHPQEAYEFYLKKRLAPGVHHFPVQKLLAAGAQMKSMPHYDSGLGRQLTQSEIAGNQAAFAANLQGGGSTNTLGLLTSWSFLGPGNIYAAGVGGGIWKSTNGGGSWTPTGVGMPNIAVSALAMDPNNDLVVYAGTGEGFFNGDALSGAGIFKTTDGGVTGSQVASDTVVGTAINKIVVSKNNSNHVYAATSTGLWISLDGGTTWNLAQTPTPSSVTGVGGCTDLAMRTDVSTDWVIVSCGQLNASTQKVFVNTDVTGAGSWTLALSDTGAARTSIAIAKSQQTTVYAMSASSSSAGGNFAGGLFGFYKSTDGGQTWSVVYHNSGDPTVLANDLLTNVSGALGGTGCVAQTGPYNNQGWYDNVLAVDPANASKVYAGGIDLFRSDDGGATWGIMSYWWLTPGTAQYSHADHHALVFDPNYNGTTVTTLYVGDDGGIEKTANPTAATSTNACPTLSTQLGSLSFTNLNNGYGVTQFYDGQPFSAGTSYIAGAQDNGTDAGTDAGGPNAWTQIFGGDGGFVAVDPSTSVLGSTSVIYEEYVNGAISKSSNGGSSWTGVTSGITDSGFLFIAPFIMDPTNSQVLWTGGTKIWRTSNGATGWVQAASNTSSGSFSAFAVAPTNDNIVFAGDSVGNIYSTTTGTTATSSTAWTSTALSSGNYISWIAVDPTNASIVYATVSTFGSGQTHVWKSTNGGASWTASDNAASSSSGIPDIAADSVIVDTANHNIVYVGTDLGVFVSTDGGSTWSVENTNYANVATDSMKIVGGDLYTFTHGRGAWRVPLANPSSPTYTLAATGSNQVAWINQPFTITGTATAVSGYNSSVNLTCTGQSTAFTCSNPATTVTPGAAVAWSATANAGGTTGTTNFTVHGVGTDTNSTTVDLPYTINLATLSLGAPSPSAAQVTAGNTVSFNVTVSFNSFSGTINFGCNSLPSNASCTFSPSSVTQSTPASGSSTVQVTIHTAANSSLGADTVAVTASAFANASGTQFQTPAQNFVVTVAGFSLSATSATSFPNISKNITATSTAIASSYNKMVTLGCTGSGVSCTLPAAFSLTNANSPQVNTIAVQAASVGSFPFTVSGNDTTATVTTSSTLTVVDFNPTALSSTSATINNGASFGPVTFTVSSVGGFAGSITPACGNLTTGITCSFTPSTITLASGGSQSVSLTFNSTANATATSDPITVSLTDAGGSGYSKGVGTFTLTLSGTNANANLVLGSITPANNTVVAAASTVSFSVPVSNSGPDTAHNVKLATTLPTGYAFVATGSAPSCSATGQSVTCNAGTVNSGGNTTFTVNASAGAVGASSTSFLVSADEPDNTPGNNSGAITTIVPDFTNTVSNSPLTVMAGAANALNLTGKLTALNGYASGVNLTCTAGAGSVPSKCTPPASAVTPTSGGAGYSVAVTNSAAGDFTFAIHGVGADADAATHDAAVAIHVVDFSLGNLSHTSGSENRGASLSETFDVTSLNNYADTMALSCGSLPANVNCSFSGTGVSGTSLTLAAAATQSVTVTITSSTSSTAGTTSITFNVASASPSVVTKQLSYSLTLNSTVANADLGITGSQSPSGTVTSGNVTYNLTASSAGPNPATSVLVTSSTPAGYTFVSVTPSIGSCNSALPLSCNLGTFNSGDSATITVVLHPAPGTTTVSFNISSGTADNNSANNLLSINTPVPDYTLAASNSPLTVFPSVSATLSGTASAINGYSSVVNLSCTGTGAPACSAASVTPSGTFNVPATAPGTTGSSTFNIAGVGTDAYTASHTASFTLQVVDYTLGSLSSSSATVNNGASAATSFSVASNNGFSGSLALSCPSLPASGVTCSFSGTGVSGNTLTLTSGATANVTVDFITTANAPTSTTLSIPMQVDATTPSARSKQTASFSLTLSGTNANADVSLAGPAAGTAAAGANVTYHFVVADAGPNNATNVQLTYPLPTGYAFVSAVDSQGSCSGTATVTCSLGTINAGSSATADITVKANVPGTSTGTATISSSDDSTTGNNQVTTSTTVPDYSLAASNSGQGVFPGQSIQLNGTATTSSGYSSVVNLTCTGASAPTCSAASVTPSSSGAAFTVNATAPSSTGNPSFTITGTGTDAITTTHTTPYSLLVFDFGVNGVTPASASVDNGVPVGPVHFTVDAVNGYSGTITMSCGGMPTGVTCSFTPASFTLSTTQSVSLTINTTANATAFSGNIQIKATASTPAARTQSANFALTLSGTNANANLAITGSQSPTGNVPSGSNVTYSIAVANNGPDAAHNVAVTYMLPAGYIFVSTTGSCTGSSTLTCSLGTINNAASATPFNIVVTPAPGNATNSFVVAATESDLTPANNTLTFTTAAADFSLAANPATVSAFPGGTATLNGTATAINGFSSSVALSCSGLSCAASSVTPSGAGQAFAVNVTAPSTTGATNVTVSGNSGAITHMATFTVNTFDFTLSAPSVTLASATTGGSTQAISMTVNGVSGYTGSISMSCSGLPAGASCAFTPSTFNASAGQTVMLTISGATSIGDSTVTINAGATTPTARTKSQTLTLNVGNFTLGSSGTGTPTATVLAGNPGIYNLSIAGTNWESAVNLSCSGLPAHTSCQFNPTNPVPLNGTISFQLTITTTKGTVAQRAALGLKRGLGALAMGMPFFGIFIVGAAASRRRKRFSAMVCMGLVLLLAFALTGCGSTSTPTVTHQPGTAAGTYTVTVSAQSAAVTQTLPVQLIVQ